MKTIPLPKDGSIRDPAIIQNALRFAYGNARIDNPCVTWEMIVASVEEAFAIVETLPAAKDLV